MAQNNKTPAKMPRVKPNPDAPKPSPLKEVKPNPSKRPEQIKIINK